MGQNPISLDPSEFEVISLKPDEFEVQDIPNPPQQAGIPTPPAGRGMGAYTGPQLPPHPSTKQPEGIFQGIGWKQAVREELPYAAASAFTGPLARPLIGTGMKIIPQLLMRAGVAGLTAGTTQAVGDAVLPDEVSPKGAGDRAKSAATATVTKGVIPEFVGSVAGEIAGWAAKKAGNLMARRGAAARNAALMERTVNPRRHQMSPGAGEVGQEFQLTAADRANATKKPLEEGFEKHMSSQFGESRKIEIKEGEPSDFMMSEKGTMTPIPDAPPMEFTAREVGPSIAQLHNKNARLGVQARKSSTAGPNPAAMQQSRNYNQMAEIAEQNGFTMDEYNRLGNAWREMMETHFNPQMKAMAPKPSGQASMMGTDVIDFMANPSKWKGFTVKGPDGTAIPLDAPQILNMMRKAVGPETMSKMMAAIGKRHIRNAAKTGKLNPEGLLKSLNELETYGVDKSLMHGVTELKQMAKILRDKTYDPFVPHVYGGRGPATVTSFINWAMKKGGLETPDVARALQQMAGKKGKGEKLAGAITRLLTYGMGAGAEYALGTENIPNPPTQTFSNPPARAQGAFNGRQQ